MPKRPSPRSRPKTSNACQRCRRKKTKCSGVAPCQSCSERSLSCIFDEVEKKVMVSESYLDRLKSAAAHYEQDPRARAERSPSPAASERSSNLVRNPLESDAPRDQPEVASASLLTPVDEALPPIRNPLTSPESFFLVDSSGRQRYLGPTSSLSFSWHVRSFLKTAVGDAVAIDLVPVSEEGTYGMASAFTRESLPLVDNEIPSREYARYLAETALFHLGDLYHVCDRDSFFAQLDRFYDDGSCDRPLKTLWHTQLLLVIAFGKLFLRRGASSLGPPGAAEVLRALKFQPDRLDLWDDAILHVEVLCLVSLYLLTALMRGTAYVFIGQAMRIALALGMNREPPARYLEQAEHDRRRRLWWTVYIIDKKLSLSAGAPPGVQDDDIDVSLPGPHNRGVSSSALDLHVKLANLEGRVMTTAYRLNGTVDRTFVTGIQTVFSSMVKTAEDFKGDFSLDLQRPHRISRVTAALHIMYYQCTVIATRPVMFALMKQRVTLQTNSLPAPKSVADPVMALVKTCVGAATKIIRILSILHEQDLVEPFLPFDLIAVFAAGVILILTSIACPTVIVDDDCVTKADEILAWMHSKGNVPASSRRAELAELWAAASRIHTEWARTTSDSQPPGDELASLWDVLIADGGTLDLDSALLPVDLWSGDALMAGIDQNVRSQSCTLPGDQLLDTNGRSTLDSWS